MRAPRVVGLALFLSACVDPLASDDVERPELVKPAGALVESIVVDEAKADQIRTNDGVDTASDPLVRANVGFWNGVTVRFWDFDEASPTAIPLYKLVREDPNGTRHEGGKAYSDVEHAVIFDKVPGDAGYSPWWTVVLLPVTDAYDGELITSFAAVEEAKRQGLVTMEVVTDEVVNCPVVAPEARLERTVDGPPEPPEEAYYRGKIIQYFSFDHIHTDEPIIAAPPVYELRREGGEPLSERERGVDITNDGDLLDTNDVFTFGPGDAEYTGFVRATNVVVSGAKMAIDTTADEAESDFRAIDDLFDGDAPRADVVVSVSTTQRVLNRPMAR